MLPPHQTPSIDLLERIRRYIAEHLCDAVDVIETARREMPRHDPRPFAKERERRGVMHKELPKQAGAFPPLIGAGIFLDDVLLRLKSKLNKADETFIERLLRLIEERGMTDVEAYKRAGIDRKRFSKLRNGQPPSAKTIYAFIFALRLNLDEAKDLLASAGYTISPAREYDLAMQYCIEKGFDIDTVNEILYALGMDVL